MSQALSIRLHDENKIFLDIMKKRGVIPSKAINRAIELYKKYLLQEELMKEAMMEDTGDLKESMSDFEQYYSIVKDDETI